MSLNVTTEPTHWALDLVPAKNHAAYYGAEVFALLLTRDSVFAQPRFNGNSVSQYLVLFVC